MALRAARCARAEEYARLEGSLCLADGEAACMRGAREQLRKGARLIKVCASGGVLSEIDDPVHQQFTVTELRAIVEVAAMAGRAVPTRTIIEDKLASAATVPDYAMAKLRAIADVHASAVARALAAGVTVAMGTDIALTGPDLPNSWGRNGSELVHLAKLGMTPLQAIEAATATGPLTLGPQAPRSGLLETGYDADVITLDADPLADISVLDDPAHVTAVWRGGRQVKGAAA